MPLDYMTKAQLQTSHLSLYRIQSGSDKNYFADKLATIQKCFKKKFNPFNANCSKLLLFEGSSAILV